MNFKEIQTIKQWWIWIIAIGLALLFVWGIIQQIFLGKPFGNSPASDLGLLLLSILPFGMLIMLWFIQMRTTISEQQISVVFFPFYKKDINKSEIEKAYVRTYNAMKEYGGWGVRNGNGRAYTISGNKGLQLELKNGKKILIGTQKSEELSQILKDFLIA